MMQSSLSTICVLLVLIQVAIVSAIELGYDCDEEFISENRLNEISEEAKAAHDARHLPSEMEKLLKRYEGPPFRRSYLLWPVSSRTKYYAEAARTPYRAVLDDEFHVFSVIMTNGRVVRECRMREGPIGLNSLSDYICGGRAVIRKGEIRYFVSRECKKITQVASSSSPARYDGPSYEGFGKQLYIASFLTPQGPIFFGDDNVGEKFIVFNNLCNVIGVVIKSENSDFIKCDKM